MTGVSAMKRSVVYFMTAVAAMAAFSCAKELDTTKVSDREFIPKVISAFTDDDVTADTKTSLSGVSVVWSSTDNIKGFDGSDVHTSTATAISDGGKKATFTFSTVSIEDDLFYIAYPAENVSDIDDDYVYASIPSTQAAAASSFANGANIAVADGMTADPLFKNVGGLLSFTINNDDITSVTLSANENLTGDSKISMAPATFAAATITSGKKSVTLSGTIANGSEYYAVVYPGTYTGLKIEVTNTSGQVATYTNPNPLTVGRNSNLHIASLTIPGGKWVTPTKGSAYTWTLASGDLGSTGSPSASVTKGTPSITWNAVYTWGSGSANKFFGWDGTKGVQIGSGSADNKCTSLVLSTSGYTEYIQNIRINFSQASSGGASVSVNVGDVALKNGVNTTVNATTTATNYIFAADELVKGDVTLSFANSAAKAFYIKSIEINPDLREEQSLSFPQAAYSVELTDGTFANPGLSGASTTVTYTSSDNDIATVNSSTGLVTLVSTGTVTITATAEADEDYQEGSASYSLTVNSGPSSIASVISASNDASVYTSGVVAQVNAKGFIMTDGTDNILVYQNATPSVAVGQAVKVSGTRGAYNNVPQISSPIITEGVTGQTVVRTAKTTISSSNCTGHTYSTYVELCGTLTISGSYYNIAIDGGSVQGSLYQVIAATSYSGSTLADMNGSIVNVVGYITGNSASYLYIAPVDVKFLDYDTPEDAGYAEDSSIDITVNANCSWTAAKGTDANNIIKSVTYNSTTVTVTFNANAGDEKTAQIVLTPDAGTGLSPVNVTVTQVANGASVVPPNETITFSSLGYSNQETVSSIAGTNLDISFTDGSTATAYYTTGTGIRIYGGGSFTVTAKGTHKIKSVSCTYSAAGNAPNSDSSNNNYATYSTTGTSADGSLTFGVSSTWTCATNDPASSVTITRKSGSGHWRFQSVTVEFAE